MSAGLRCGLEERKALPWVIARSSAIGAFNKLFLHEVTSSFYLSRQHLKNYMKIDTKLLLSACVLVLLVTLIAKDSTSALFGFVAAVCALAYDLKLEAGKEKDELTKQLLSLQNQISDLKAKVDALLLTRGSR